MGNDLALLVHIESDDHDPLLARWLRTELLDLDVATVEPLRDETDHPGAKGLSTLITALLVNLAPPALQSVVTRIHNWSAHNGHPVEITLDGDTLKITGTPTNPEEQLVAAWLAKHAPSAI